MKFCIYEKDGQRHAVLSISDETWIKDTVAEVTVEPPTSEQLKCLSEGEHWQDQSEVAADIFLIAYEMGQSGEQDLFPLINVISIMRRGKGTSPGREDNQHAQNLITLLYNKRMKSAHLSDQMLHRIIELGFAAGKPPMERKLP